MRAANPARQRSARKTLKEIFADASNVWVIHYSCESFDNIDEGRSPRITSIALRKLDSAQTALFSIHKVAETRGVPMDEISEHYDCLEKEMLLGFFGHLKNFQQMRYLHWNMRDSSYGFQAIEHRFRVLGGDNEKMYVVDDKNKTDMSRLLIDIYGRRYIGHPRLEKLVEKNHITRLSFLTGAQEARAFERKEFVSLHRSTLRKVDMIANIGERAFDRTLKTNTSWLGMHGGRIIEIWNWLTEHPKLSFAGVVLTIILAILGIVFY